MGEMLKLDPSLCTQCIYVKVRNSKLCQTSVYKANCPTSDLERVIIYIYSIRKQICLCSFKTLCYPDSLEKLGQVKICSPEMWKLHGKLSPNIRMSSSGFSHVSIIAQLVFVICNYKGDKAGSRVMFLITPGFYFSVLLL